MRSERGEESQMMLLAAIVLLVAFVSMAVMISRVTLVANETSRDQHGPFLREAAAVARALQAIDAGASSDAQLGTMVADLQGFEAQRGFLLSWSCDDSTAQDNPNIGDPANDLDDIFRLTDGRSTFLIELDGASDCSVA